MKTAPLRFAAIISVAGFLALGSCAPVGPGPTSPVRQSQKSGTLLNSERIRQKFGSYGIDIVRQSKQLRVSDLYSLEGGKKVMRTLAVVIYPQSIAPPLMAEHAEIKSGHSIGKVFKSHGWSIDKRNLYFGDIVASDNFAGVYSAMGGIHEVNLAVHIYQLSVGKNGAWFRYARIAEVHHPDYLGSDELREIYGAPAGEPEFSHQDIQATLNTVVGVMAKFQPEN